MTPKEFFSLDLQYGDPVVVTFDTNKTYGDATANNGVHPAFYAGLKAWNGTIKNPRWDLMVNFRAVTKNNKMSSAGLFSDQSSRFVFEDIKKITVLDTDLLPRHVSLKSNEKKANEWFYALPKEKQIGAILAWTNIYNRQQLQNPTFNIMKWFREELDSHERVRFHHRTNTSAK